MISVLIVDNKSIRLILEKIVSDLNFNVKAASNGHEVLDIIKNSDMNILVTAWVMPYIDGVTLYRMIRSMDLGHYIYILFITYTSLTPVS